MNKTKKTIFTSAIKVISDKGYDGATMDDIALNAGVAKGTLYYHFKSKEEIFNFIITEGIKLMEEQVNDRISFEEDGLSKLRKLCEVQLKIIYENKDFFKVIMSELWGKEIRQSYLREIITKYLDKIQKYIEEGMDEGSIKQGESKCISYIFFGTLCSAAVYELMNTDRQEIDDFIHYVVDEFVLKIINR